LFQTHAPGHLPLANLEHLFYNCALARDSFSFCAYYVTCSIRKLLPKASHDGIALWITSPHRKHTVGFTEAGIFKRMRVFQPGMDSVRLQGIFSSRYFRLSKHPIFVPPLFL
jgi:hypothetical protein